MVSVRPQMFVFAIQIIQVNFVKILNVDLILRVIRLFVTQEEYVVPLKIAIVTIKIIGEVTYVNFQNVITLFLQMELFVIAEVHVSLLTLANALIAARGEA